MSETGPILIRDECKWKVTGLCKSPQPFLCPMEVFDETGRQRAKFIDANVLAHHFMFAMEELDKRKAEFDRLQAIVKSQAAMLALFNDEGTCHVEFDTQVTLDKFLATERDLAAAQAAKEKPCT